MNSFRDCFCKYSALIYHKLYQKFLLLYGWFTGSLRMERWTCWAWFTFAAGSGSRKYSGSPCCSSNLSIFPLTSPDEAVCLQSTCLIFFFALVVNIEMLLMTWKMILHSTSHHHCDPPMRGNWRCCEISSLTWVRLGFSAAQMNVDTHFTLPLHTHTQHHAHILHPQHATPPSSNRFYL